MKKNFSQHIRRGLPGGPNEINKFTEGFIETSQGQWAYPGQNTLIPNAGGRITMQGVKDKVLGIDDQGNSIMMMPGADYQFPGDSVFEIPIDNLREKLNPARPASIPRPHPWGFLVDPKQAQGNIVGGVGINFPRGLGFNATGVLPVSPDPVFKGVGSLGVNQQFGNLNIGASIGTPLLRDYYTRKLKLDPELSLSGRYTIPYSNKRNTSGLRLQEGGPKVKQRRGVRENFKHSVWTPSGPFSKPSGKSSHKMRAEYIPGRGWVGFPSLFQDSKPYADDQQNWVDMSKEEDWKKVYEEAVRRGEVYDFGEDKEAAVAFGMGSWKDQLPQQQKGGPYDPSDKKTPIRSIFTDPRYKLYRDINKENELRDEQNKNIKKQNKLIDLARDAYNLRWSVVDDYTDSTEWYNSPQFKVFEQYKHLVPNKTNKKFTKIFKTGPNKTVHKGWGLSDWEGHKKGIIPPEDNYIKKLPRYDWTQKEYDDYMDWAEKKNPEYFKKYNIRERLKGKPIQNQAGRSIYEDFGPKPDDEEVIEVIEKKQVQPIVDEINIEETNVEEIPLERENVYVDRKLQQKDIVELTRQMNDLQSLEVRSGLNEAQAARLNEIQSILQREAQADRDALDYSFYNQGGYIEAELTDEEIEEYQKGGYIVEELQKGGYPDNLIKAQGGMSVAPIIDESGRASCPEGYTWNPKTRYCERESPRPEGYTWDETKKKYVSDQPTSSVHWKKVLPRFEGYTNEEFERLVEIHERQKQRFEEDKAAGIVEGTWEEQGCYGPKCLYEEGEDFVYDEKDKTIDQLVPEYILPEKIKEPDYQESPINVGYPDYKPHLKRPSYETWSKRKDKGKWGHKYKVTTPGKSEWRKFKRSVDRGNKWNWPTAGGSPEISPFRKGSFALDLIDIEKLPTFETKKKYKGWDPKEIAKLNEAERLAKESNEKLDFKGLPVHGVRDLVARRKYNKAYKEYEKQLPKEQKRKEEYIAEQNKIKKEFLEKGKKIESMNTAEREQYEKELALYNQEVERVNAIKAEDERIREGEVGKTIKQRGGASGNYIELELDDNEIAEYVKGGYIVEEIPSYQTGGWEYPDFSTPRELAEEMFREEEEVTPATAAVADSSYDPNETVYINDFRYSANDIKYLNEHYKQYCPHGDQGCLEQTWNAYDIVVGQQYPAYQFPKEARMKENLNMQSLPKMRINKKGYGWQDGQIVYGTFDSYLPASKKQVDYINSIPYFDPKDDDFTVDSWDIHGKIVNEGGTNIYSRTKNKDFATYTDAEKMEMYKKIPVGAMIGWSTNNRKISYNRDKGLTASNHSTMVVGYDERGVPVVYDYGVYTPIDRYRNDPVGRRGDESSSYDWTPKWREMYGQGAEFPWDSSQRRNAGTTYHLNSLTNISIPKDVKGKNIDWLKKNNLYNHQPKELGFSYDALREEGDPKELDAFYGSLKTNKGTLMNDLKITNDEYNKYSKWLMAISMQESTGGSAPEHNIQSLPAVTALTDIVLGDPLGETQGLTQLNIKNILDDPKLKKIAEKYGITRESDLFDPKKAAIASMIYAKTNMNSAIDKHKRGIKPGMKTFKPNPRSTVYDGNSFNTEEGKEVEFFTGHYKTGFGYFRDIEDIQADLDKIAKGRYRVYKNFTGKIYVDKKTKGNSDLKDYEKFIYHWQSPYSLTSGDAQGMSNYSKQVNDYLKTMKDI